MTQLELTERRCDHCGKTNVSWRDANGWYCSEVMKEEFAKIAAHNKSNRKDVINDEWLSMMHAADGQHKPAYNPNANLK